MHSVHAHTLELDQNIAAGLQTQKFCPTSLFLYIALLANVDTEFMLKN